MLHAIRNWFNKRIPQNYILNKPYIGAIVFFVISFGFLIIYKPLEARGARSFGLGLTMGMYGLVFAAVIITLAKLIKKLAYFSDENDWTILKELLSILIILAGMGIAVYFAGFLIEVHSSRWNFRTFSDSCEKAFLIGIIPFGFFTLVNYRYIFFSDVVQSYYRLSNESSGDIPEEPIHIISQLKKEEVSFYPSQLVYAESDGNYVVFHLEQDGKQQKKIVRNSINNIEQQLSVIPFIFRIHRAYIVNLKRIQSKKGNTLGYRLKMIGSDDEIPVSRQNTRNFNTIIRQSQ